MVDTQGLLIHVLVHAADIQDRDGGVLVVSTLFGLYPFLAALLGQQIADFDTKIKEVEVKLTAAHKANAVSQRLATVPG